MPEEYGAVLTISLRLLLNDCGGLDPSPAAENGMSILCSQALLDIQRDAAVTADEADHLDGVGVQRLRAWAKDRIRTETRRLFEEAVNVGLPYCPSHPIFVAFVDALQQEITRLSRRLWKWLH